MTSGAWASTQRKKPLRAAARTPLRLQVMTRNTARTSKPASVEIPRDVDNATLQFGERSVTLTNLRKPFWPELGITKGDLLRYYADVAPLLVPYMAGRAQVMKRYPHGAGGEYFYMKRTPSNAPPWLRTCSIE